MSNEFFGSHYLGFTAGNQPLELCVPGNKEVAFLRAAEDQDLI
jgi:hypothetical protein